jgi:hypothetical protein
MDWFLAGICVIAVIVDVVVVTKARLAMQNHKEEML